MLKIKLDYEQLRRRCIAEETEFFELGDVVTVGSGTNESFYIYQNNGANILAVAHLDSVLMPNVNWTFQSAKLGNNGAKKTIIWNAQLDDRLGAYIILDLLPSLIGENQYDILLTTDEEVGRSTAENFVPPEGKEYNWMFQFDRRGTGAVLYDYDDSTWRPIVAEFLNVQQGSYSDISKLQHLGVKALNVGTGYHDEHTASCHMVVQETLGQVRDFMKFFSVHKDIKYPHTKREHTYRSYGYNSASAAGGYFSNGVWKAYSDDDQEDWYNWRGTASSGTKSNITSTMSASQDPRNWIALPNCVELTVKLKDADELVTMFIHPVTGNQAIICDVCQEVDNIHEISWTLDGHPICHYCVNHALPESEASTVSEIMPDIIEINDDANVVQDIDKLVWVSEGGRIRKNGYNWIRILPLHRKDVPDSPTVLCRRCTEPEWKVEAFLESGDSQSPVYYCRWCHEKANQPEDEEDTRQFRPQFNLLPPSESGKPIPLPAPRTGINVRQLLDSPSDAQIVWPGESLSPAMDDDDKDFFGAVRDGFNNDNSSTPVSPFDVTNPDDGSVG